MRAIPMRKLGVLAAAFLLALTLGASVASAGEDDDHFVDCNGNPYALADALTNGGGTFLVVGTCHGPIVIENDTKLIGFRGAKIRHASVANATERTPSLISVGPVITVDPGAKLQLVFMKVVGGNTQGGIVNRGTLKLIGSVVANNDRTEVDPDDGQGGGGISNFGGDVKVLLSKIKNNRALTDTSFTPPIRRDGGGIWSKGGSLVVKKSVVSGNHADDQGGGIQVRDGGTAKIKYSVVARNSAIAPLDEKEGEGGGLHVIAGATVTVHRSWFVHNRAQANGGGAAARKAVIDGYGMKFIGNEALNGGGLYIADSVNHTVLRHSLFLANVATKDGGGVGVRSGLFTLENTRAMKNTAAEHGGFMRNRNGASSALNNSRITGNTANWPFGGTTAGGVYNLNNAGTVTNSGSTITDNNPNDCAGAIGGDGC